MPWAAGRGEVCLFPITKLEEERALVWAPILKEYLDLLRVQGEAIIFRGRYLRLGRYCGLATGSRRRRKEV
jgi:hypothetical protein